MDPAELSASEAARRLRAGELRSEELVRACLARIEALEPEVRAWQHLDADYALEQARRADAARAAGLSQGPLHGVPVGVKDILDTRDLPTECGTPILAGRQPESDAAVVSRLREAGAVIMGKTVTTELAFYAPGKTRNPHDPERTPGGSSSGSAAAVACGMVPLAIGTQTNGSVIRPASFCGVVGYKPTHGLISRRGVLTLSPPLDTVGVFARTVEDAALLADGLIGHDPEDRDTAPRAHPRLAETAAQEPPLDPVLAFARTPVWDQAEEATAGAFAELAELLGEGCDEVELPEPFERAVGWHRSLMVADFAKNLQGYYERGRDRLSQVMVQAIEEGRGVSAVDYNRAAEWRTVLNRGLDEVFERYDAILTPAAPGEAPRGLDGTGNPIFCTLWTFCGTPAVSLPLLVGENGLPLGAQLIGRRGDDARLLRTARRLVERVRAAGSEEGK